MRCTCFEDSMSGETRCWGVLRSEQRRLSGVTTGLELDGRDLCDTAPSRQPTNITDHTEMVEREADSTNSGHVGWIEVERQGGSVLRIFSFRRLATAFKFLLRNCYLYFLVIQERVCLPPDRRPAKPYQKRVRSTYVNEVGPVSMMWLRYVLPFAAQIV